MKIAWIHGRRSIEISKPYTWLVLGVRGSGKSAFLEHLAELHLKEGNTVLDLFAARSGENLGWLRSKWIKKKKALLLTAENTTVEYEIPHLDVKPYFLLELEDFEKYDIIINSSPLYRNIDEEFKAVNTIIDKLWKRLEWKRMVFVMVREAANLLYARMKIAENQTLAKTFLSYWLREARHTGCSLALDSQRFMAIDIEIRNLCDFIIFKAQGSFGLPKDLHYVYKYIEPTWLQKAKPNQFAILSKEGCIGVGIFPCPEWHVKEGEGIVRKLNMKIIFKERPEEAIDRGTYITVGDREHAQIIEYYIKHELGMRTIAIHMKRSSRTVKEHIDKHNEAILKIGFCPSCRRVENGLDKQIARKRKPIEKEVAQQTQT